MTPQRFQQIEQVFEAAADASSQERGAVIERLCRDDAELRAEVEALLAAAPVASPRIRNAIGHAAGEVRAAGEGVDAPGAVLQRGTRIGDRFTIDRFARIGGMGEVYRATDEHTGAPIAIKLLRKDRNADGRRFEREAKLLAGVDHPHVVRHVAHGTLASGERYLAMEWLEGETLDELLARRRLTVGESVRLALGLAEALDALHRRGIVHRDLKPSNVFLVGGALPAFRLLDLGIAWSSACASLTETGLFVGSVRYAAPEQVSGARSFDARTDVFSLGLVLFECLVGAPAFEEAHPVAVMTRMVLGELPRLRDRACGLPEPLVDLVDRMLARDLDRRPTGGAEVARALRALVPVAEAASPAQACLPAAWGRSAQEDATTLDAAMDGAASRRWGRRGMTTTRLAAC